jgi:hypothetical protein
MGGQAIMSSIQPFNHSPIYPFAHSTMPSPATIVLLDSFHEPMAAHVARTRLEAAGIPCFLSNENLVSLNPLLSPIVGGVRLHVRQEDLEEARQLLQNQVVPPAQEPDVASFAADAPDPTTPRCPRCGSADVAYGAATKGGARNWFYLLLSVLLRYPLRGRRYHCFHCGNEFD